MENVCLELTWVSASNVLKTILIINWWNTAKLLTELFVKHTYLKVSRTAFPPSAQGHIVVRCTSSPWLYRARFVQAYGDGWKGVTLVYFTLFTVFIWLTEEKISKGLGRLFGKTDCNQSLMWCTRDRKRCSVWSRSCFRWRICWSSIFFVSGFFAFFLTWMRKLGLLILMFLPDEGVPVRQRGDLQLRGTSPRLQGEVR